MDVPHAYFDQGAFGIISTVGAGATGAELVQNAVVTISTANMGSDVVCYMPFVLSVTRTIYGAIWQNGGTASGNVDIGIMDAEGSRVASIGSTAQGSINAAATANLSGGSVVARPGWYYVAFTQDNGTGTVLRVASQTTLQNRAVGIMSETTGSFGVPSTMSPSGSPSTWPVVGLALNSTF